VIMTRAPTIPSMEQRLRLAICPHCAWAKPAKKSGDVDAVRACEKNCPLFKQLPRIKQAADLLDPLLRNRHVVMRDVIRHIAREASAKAGKCPEKAGQAKSLGRRADRIAKAIGALFRW